MNTKQPEAIDMTPTWAAILPVLILGLTDGNAEGRAIAQKELVRMAQAADQWNATAPGREAAQIVGEFAKRARKEYEQTKELTTNNGGTCMTIRVPVALLNRIRDMAEAFGIKA